MCQLVLSVRGLLSPRDGKKKEFRMSVLAGCVCVSAGAGGVGCYGDARQSRTVHRGARQAGTES